MKKTPMYTTRKNKIVNNRKNQPVQKTAEYVETNHPELNFDELFFKAYGYAIDDLPTGINKELFRSIAILPEGII